MTSLRIFVGCVILTLSGSAVSAQVMDDDTKCGAIASLFEAPSPDRQRVKEVVNYIIETMQAVDRLHGRSGKFEIFPSMTEDARSSLALIVSDRCRNRSSLTVADIAIETYEALRAIKPSTSLNKPVSAKRKPSRASASIADRHPASQAAIQRAPAEF